MEKSCKLLCLVLVLCLMLPMFAGCAGGGGNTPPPNHEVSGTAGNDNTEATEPSTGNEVNDPVDPTTGKDEAGSEVVGGEQGENPANPDITDPGTEVPGGDAPDVPDDPEVPTEPGHEHAYVEAVVAATCTEAGYTQYTCTCGDTYRDSEVASKGHIWNDWVVTKEATETAEGSEKRTCGNCTEAETRVIPVVIPGHSHSYVSKVTKQATCTSEGVKTFTCQCGHSYTEAISKAAHAYTKKVVAPTCTSKGYTLNTCSCGKSFKDSYTDKAAHSYKDTVVKATCKAEGYTLHKCSSCSESYKDKYTEKADHDYKLTSQEHYYHTRKHADVYHCAVCEKRNIEYFPMAQEEYDAFCREVEAAIVKYLNQYRVEQGDTEMEYLPRCSLVAQYRAEQLKERFCHDSLLLREAHAYYQYGKYHDMTKYGLDASHNYWGSNCMEAIATAGTDCGADYIAERVVRLFRNSSAHWSYLGSSEYKYVGVGYSCDESGGYVCILQPDANYG